MSEWVPVSPAGTIWRAGSALVWRRYRVEGGPWSAVPDALDTHPRHGFETPQAAARFALGVEAEQ